MYKEMAKTVAEERNSYNDSASETIERIAKLSHDHRTSLQELHASQAEAANARNEAAALRQDLETGRVENKSLHSKKLAAEKSVAEAMTVNSRLETSIEELRQKLNVACIDLDKAQRTISNQTLSLGDNRVDVQQLIALKSDVKALQNELSVAKAVGRQREQDLSRELTAMREANLTQERELEALRKKQNAHRSGFDDAVVELEKARIEMEAVVGQRDRLQRELAQMHSKKTESHIQELRSDLEVTMKEWKGFESEKSLRDEQFLMLQKELQRERAKHKLLEREVAALEDKLRIVQQEVGVYRSIGNVH
jgi:chromosome segregation ATPase